MARLEIELGRVHIQTRTISDIASAAGERLSTCLATTILAPQGRFRKPESLLPLTSKYFLAGSPLPYLSRRTLDNDEGEQTQERSPPANSLSSIPRHVIDIMLRHYCEIYRPQYPAVEESDLYKACDRVYNDTHPTDFDIFCVHITLAISVWAPSSQRCMAS